MIVSGGNIQNVNRSNDINTYSSDYAIYQPIKAFPVEPDDPLSIPQPLTSSNPLSRSDNTYNNNFMNTQTTDTSLTRMNESFILHNILLLVKVIIIKYQLLNLKDLNLFNLTYFFYPFI